MWQIGGGGNARSCMGCVRRWQVVDVDRLRTATSGIPAFLLPGRRCFDFAPVYDPSRPSIPGLHTPNRWPEGEVRALVGGMCAGRQRW